MAGFFGDIGAGWLATTHRTSVFDSKLGPGEMSRFLSKIRITETLALRKVKLTECAANCVSERLYDHQYHNQRHEYCRNFINNTIKF